MTVGRPRLPTELEPGDSERLRLPSGAEAAVGVARPRFQEWRGEPIGNTFGGKPLIDTGGVAEFAELAILRCFERAGWTGRWLEPYGAPKGALYMFTGWQDCPLSAQPQTPLTDPEATRLLEQIASHAGGYGGCWDVFAWTEGRYVFAEGKRSKKDTIRTTQTRWLEAALGCGCNESDFIIVEWTLLSNRGHG